ncbi:MAG: hypothetical protein OET79_08815 [Nitrospirota bacterium]|nr:hypothetical protein [Nitrospirota bacterium]
MVILIEIISQVMVGFYVIDVPWVARFARIVQNARASGHATQYMAGRSGRTVGSGGCYNAK